MRKMNKTLALLALMLLTVGCLEENQTGETTNTAPPGVFQLSCNTDSPLNPAVIIFTQTQMGATFCEVRNGNEEGNYIITVEIPEWSEKASQTVFLKPNEIRVLQFTLAFKDKLYKNREYQTAQVSYAAEKNGQQVYSAVQDIGITSATQLVFVKEFGNETVFVPFLAAQWVTPNDPCVEKVISAAKELMPNRAFSDYQGYAGKTDEEKALLTMQQAQAVYETLQAHGMSYVNSLITFGDPKDFSQNVRLPFESIETKNANCIDGTVLYAAIFEKIGLEPIIIIVPGHAFVAVRNDRNSSSVTFIETTATGTKSFQEAAIAAEERYNQEMEDLRQGNNQSMAVIIDVKTARSLKVLPFPNTRDTCLANVTTPVIQYPNVIKPLPQTQYNCQDGTQNFQCSTNQPNICLGGILWPDCFTCGCPTGTNCFFDGNCYSN
ncbi:MAG: hypothetical protein ABH803_03245 [Candidatus Micrarchaeota archaeon]